MNAINKIIEPFQVTRNGTVLLYQIENELPNQWSNVSAKTPDTKHVDYMKRLEANVRDLGIDIPSIHNMPSTNGKSWSKDYDTVGAGGDVDIYGLDSYVCAVIKLPLNTTNNESAIMLVMYPFGLQHIKPIIYVAGLLEPFSTSLSSSTTNDTRVSRRCIDSMVWACWRLW